MDIAWTLQQLTDFLTTQMSLEAPQRLRNLQHNRLFVKEELETQLRNYEDFQEGGARIQIESGRYATMAEMTVKVAIYQKDDEPRHYYISADSTVQEL